MVITPPDQDFIADPDGDLAHVLCARYPTPEHAISYVLDHVPAAENPVCAGVVWMRARVLERGDEHDRVFAAEHQCEEIWEQAEPHAPDAVRYWSLALSARAKAWAADGLLD